MKKVILPLIAASVAALSANAADVFPRTFTGDTEGYFEATADYTVEASDITITHTFAGAKHPRGTLNLNGHTNVNLVLNNTDGSNPDTKEYFAFNGFTFKGNSAADVLNVSIAEGKAAARIGAGFNVDAATVNMNLSAVEWVKGFKSTYAFNVSNGGVLNWTNVPTFNSNGLPLEINISGAGSKMVFKTVGTSWIGGNNVITIDGGSFDLDTKNGRLDGAFNIKNLSDDCNVDLLGVGSGKTFDIAAGITHKIYTTNRNLVMFDNATFKAMSDVFVSTSGQAFGLYAANNTKSINIEIGTAITLRTVELNQNLTNIAVNVKLNGSLLTFLYLDFAQTSFVIEDFDNNLFRWESDKNLDLSAITAKHNGVVLTDLTTITKDGYTYLYSASIPEPATLAAVFGALALAFAAWRRRK